MPNASLNVIIIHLGTILFLHHYYFHFPIITILFQCTEETFGSDMRMTGSLLSFLLARDKTTTRTIANLFTPYKPQEKKTRGLFFTIIARTLF